MKHFCNLDRVLLCSQGYPTPRPRTVFYPISAFWVLLVVGMSHHAHLWTFSTSFGLSWINYSTKIRLFLLSFGVSSTWTVPRQSKGEVWVGRAGFPPSLPPRMWDFRSLGTSAQSRKLRRWGTVRGPRCWPTGWGQVSLVRSWSWGDELPTGTAISPWGGSAFIKFRDFSRGGGAAFWADPAEG